MYKQGDVRLLDPKCNEAYKDGDCDLDFMDNHKHSLTDSRSKGIILYVADTNQCAYLPHSCQEWVIGGKEQVETLISDLRIILKKL